MSEREKFEKWFDDNVNNFPFGSEAERNAYKRYADIVWQAAKAQAVPEGWKLVPIEITDEMQDAANMGFVGAKNIGCCVFDCIHDAVVGAIEAAPEVKDEC